ncbi:MAG: DNA translocase FtsK 4TM domain-containing protein [Patescibacteria group bacterium]
MLEKTKKQYLRKYRKEARHEIGKGDAHPEVLPRLKAETKHGITLVVIMITVLLVVLSLFGWAGTFGHGIDVGLRYLFGWGRFVVPLVLLVVGYLFFQPQKYALRTANYIGLVFLVLSYSALIHLFFVPLARAVSDISDGRGGGYAGLILSYPLEKIMGPWATGVILFGLLIISLLVLFDVSLKRLASGGNFFSRMSERFREFFYRLRVNMETTPTEEPPAEDEPAREGETSPEFGVKPINSEATQASSGKPPAATHQENQAALFPAQKKPVRKIDVPLDLLESSNAKPASGDIEAIKQKIYETLRNFGIDVEMGETKVGPTVTQYTLKPAEGVKLSQITTLSNDLALALAAHPIRIEAPIPGKSLVGIEVPNKAVAVVKLKEILQSNDFKKRPSKLTVALGKDVAGNAWVADLDPMPHLLVAGATGSGKSVCLNAILLSLLYQNSPDELKLILVDPKRVEMTGYNGIPHLITPVVNDVYKTINALRWVVAEMDRRFDLLQKTGHRNIQAYNHDNGNIMPYLVVAIDELADLMAVAANEVEAAIIRLAQMARAVGIHLILATQRPSVDIITGLIKANITSRIAFSVASAVDSRTILDTSGAEKLLGRGDMLYISAQLSKPKRLQGAFVTDDEINRVLAYLKSKGQPEYQEEVTAKVVDKTLAGNFEDLGDDDLFEQAKDLVIKTGKASASLLQRRLRVGYARAARLLDLMEEQGIIGPGDGAKPREILVSRDHVKGAEDDGFEQEDEADEASEQPDDGDMIEDDDENGQDENENNDKSQ